MKNILSLLIVGTAMLSGCESNRYSVTYNTTPEGAQLFCGGQAKGYTPVTLQYTLNEKMKKHGSINTDPCEVVWASGATAEASMRFDLAKYPKGVIYTIPRPNVSGYYQDAEFTLKVKNMRANQQIAQAQERLAEAQERVAQTKESQSILNNFAVPNIFQLNNTVQCSRMGTVNSEVKTFRGIACPLGWY